MNYLSIIILLLAVVGCQSEKPVEDSTPAAPAASETAIQLTAQQLQSTAIDTVALHKQAVSGVLRLSGKVGVDPDYRVSLSSALGGYVQSIHALPGKPVRKGQTILVLEDHQFVQLQQEYLTVQAKLLSAEPDYVRQKELNASKSTSDKALQQAETEYRSLLAAKRALEARLRLIHIDPHTLSHDNIAGSIRIPAPFDGIVSEVMVNKGKYTAPADVLVELINPAGLQLHLRVFEKDWPKIGVGQALDAYTNQDPDASIRATVIAKGAAIGEDGSTAVIARFDKGLTTQLADGLFMNATLTLDRYETYTLPEEAVVNFQGKNYVFEAIGANQFQLLEVEVGMAASGAVEIVDAEPLVAKALVGNGAYTLLMAMKNGAE